MEYQTIVSTMMRYIPILDYTVDHCVIIVATKPLTTCAFQLSFACWLSWFIFCYYHHDDCYYDNHYITILVVYDY